MTLNWTTLGTALRQSADDHHGLTATDPPAPFDIAWEFMRDNPECFIGADEWPADFPTEPPVELIAAYYGVSAELLPEKVTQ